MTPLSPRLALLAALVLTAGALHAQQKGPLRIPLGVLSGLQYDTPRFACEPGQTIEILFHNEDEMAHNLVVIEPGSRERVVAAALALGERGPELNYVPTENVLHATAVLNPGGSQTLRFDAPKKPGVYPYVCTFPGHGLLMYGAMYVGVEMPAALKDDPNVSPNWREGLVAADSETKSLHAWSPSRRPLMYRVFMPDASPAAIAIALPGDLSLCWDATSCRLRYAWHGGFVDPWPVWRGNGNGLAKLVGERFLTEAWRPYSVENGGEPSFRGYKLIDGYPKFLYRFGDVTVEEQIGRASDTASIVRRFTIQDPKGRVAPSPDERITEAERKGTTLRFTIVDHSPMKQSGTGKDSGHKGHEHGGHKK